MTLRNRLFLLVGGTLIAAVALVTLTVSAAARTAFETLDRQRAQALVGQFQRELARQEEDVARRTRLVAEGDAFQRTIIELERRNTDYARFVNEASSLSSSQGLDYLDVMSDDGTIISSAEWPAHFGYRQTWFNSRTTPPSPASSAGAAERLAAAAASVAEDGGARLRAVELPGETVLGFIAVRRISAGSRTLYLAGGRRLDQQFLQTLVLPIGTRAFLYRNTSPEGSRQQIIDANGDVAQADILVPLIARVKQTGRDDTEKVEGSDGPERVDAIPLMGADGSALAILLMTSSGRELASLVSKIRWSGLAFGALTVALGLALSYVLSSRVTQPVERLASAARSVAEGDWDVQVGHLRTSGEIAELASAFDSMTRQLVDQRQRLVQAERVAAWRELARRLAHELKNPLFPLRLTLDNLGRARSLPPADFSEVFEESLGTLVTGLANLNAVVASFNDFSKMPAPVFAQVSPNEIIERTVKLVRAQIEAGDRAPIDVRLDLDEATGLVVADGEQLSRLIQNLMLNAIDAMPKGGQLTITSRRENGVCRLRVADTGTGLTEEERQRLFTPYYTTKRHGTGLGLAIVQSVIADHGGKIWVESAPGQGTTFHIELSEQRVSPGTQGDLPRWSGTS